MSVNIHYQKRSYSNHRIQILGLSIYGFVCGKCFILSSMILARAVVDDQYVLCVCVSVPLLVFQWYVNVSCCRLTIPTVPSSCPVSAAEFTSTL